MFNLPISAIKALDSLLETVQKETVEIPGELKIKLKDLYICNNKWYNNY